VNGSNEGAHAEVSLVAAGFFGGEAGVGVRNRSTSSEGVSTATAVAVGGVALRLLGVVSAETGVAMA